jgi:hypothetical protein
VDVLAQHAKAWLLDIAQKNSRDCADFPMRGGRRSRKLSEMTLAGRAVKIVSFRQLASDLNRELFTRYEPLGYAATKDCLEHMA